MSTEDIIRDYLRRAENIIQNSTLACKSEVVVGVASILQKEIHFSNRDNTTGICSNCKWNKEGVCNNDFIYQMLSDINIGGHATDIYDGFSCSRWEAK